MTGSRTSDRARRALYIACILLSATANSATRSTVDLTVGAGASTNPGLTVGGRGSAFGRVSALATQQWLSERTTTTLTAFGENTTYLSGYGSKQIFDLRARSAHIVSPSLTIFGDVGFEGDFAGQLSNRFINAAPDPAVGNPAQPDPVIVDDPTLIGFGGRQYRLSGDAGLSLRTSARDSLSASVGAQRNIGTGRLKGANFSSYFGSLSFDHIFNERTSAGGRVSFQYQDYDQGGSAQVVNPVVTASHRFSSQVQGSASAGLLFLNRHIPTGSSGTTIDPTGSSGTTINPSFSFNLCKTGETDRLCGRASRDARNSLGVGFGPNSGGLVVSTSGGVDYSRRLDAKQTFQLSLAAVRYSRRLASGDNRGTTYLTFLTGYDRKIRQRIAVGVTAGARRLFQSGTDPKTDFTANGYLRYRLGDIE